MAARPGESIAATAGAATRCSRDDAGQAAPPRVGRCRRPPYVTPGVRLAPRRRDALPRRRNPRGNRCARRRAWRRVRVSWRDRRARPNSSERLARLPLLRRGALEPGAARPRDPADRWDCAGEVVVGGVRASCAGCAVHVGGDPDFEVGGCTDAVPDRVFSLHAPPRRDVVDADADAWCQSKCRAGLVGVPAQHRLDLQIRRGEGGEQLSLALADPAPPRQWVSVEVGSVDDVVFDHA